MATKIKMIVGIIVQINSKLVWCSKAKRTVSVFSSLNNQIVRKRNHSTAMTIIIKKNWISWCKSMIFSIIGLAGSWKFICHGSGASKVTVLFVAGMKKKELNAFGNVKFTSCG